MVYSLDPYSGPDLETSPAVSPSINCDVQPEAMANTKAAAEVADEDQPLLSAEQNDRDDAAAAGPDRPKSPTDSTDEEAGSILDDAPPLLRSVEDNVFPEASHLGRHLSWQSAYILVISRVIGSGIFATPGAVVRSVGSIGLSLLVWTVGAVVAAFGLAVSLEYGCMLPRSGGSKVYLEFTNRRPRFLASTMVTTQAVLLGLTTRN